MYLIFSIHFFLSFLSFPSCGLILIYSFDKAEDVIFYSYSRHINGFAAMLEEAEAAEIASNCREALLILISILLWCLCFNSAIVRRCPVNCLCIFNPCRTFKCFISFSRQGNKPADYRVMEFSWIRKRRITSFGLCLEGGKVWRTYHYWKH